MFVRRVSNKMPRRRRVPRGSVRMRHERRQMTISYTLLTLLLHLVVQNQSTAFSISDLSSYQRVPTKLSASTQQQAEEEARAGESGYSVLRQPVSRTNWDPQADPDFQVPLSLDQDDDAKTAVNKQDYEWFVGRRSSKYSDSSTKKTEALSAQDAEVEEEELDLFQRSLDTLDYPRVLKALNRECTTEPAKRLVHQASSQISTNTTAFYRKHQRRNPLAYQPLVADSVEGAQSRYRAVQELTFLLTADENDYFQSDGNPLKEAVKEAYYRSTRGYKEFVAGRGPPLKGNSFDLELILSAVDEGRVLETEEIMQVADMMDILQNVQRWGSTLQGLESRTDPEDAKSDIITSFVELPALTTCISVNETLQELLTTAFDQDGRISGTTFPAVGRLRARVRALRADIMGTLDGLLALPSIKNKLALESGGSLYSEVNGGRLVIPIDARYGSTIGIVHDTSRSGKTVYVEPTEVVGPTNELRQAEGELRAEEARVWRMLTQEIQNNRVSLENSVMVVGQLDLVMARILLGRRLSGVIPEVRDEGAIALRDAKHPVLLLRNVDNVVGSDVELGLDDNQGLVLTGPNSGGKTIILKLLGLMALMARGGIPVPAADREVGNGYRPRVDYFDPVLADIGDLQSVGGDLSTFSGHMLVCREVLANSGRNALVLMDEVGSGTDPNQGVALAQALLEALLETGARVAITTHFLPLKQLAASDDRFSVGGMQFVGGRPTYKLLPGTVGESFALAVAERLQLPASVINRATELLDSETRQMGDLIRDLEDQKVLMDQQATELELKKKEIAQLEQKMKEEQIRLEKKQLVARREEAKKFAKKLEQKEQILGEILEKLKSDPSRRIVAKSWDEIKFVKRDALNEAENVPSVVAQKRKAEKAMQQVQDELVPIAELRDRPDLQQGDGVVVCKKGPLLGREGIIVKVLGSRVEVNVNNMNVGLKLSEVALPGRGGGSSSIPSPRTMKTKVGKKTMSRAAEKALENEKVGGARLPKNDSVSTSNRNAGATIRTQSNTVDVRGCNLEEAKEKAQAKFSACLMSGRNVVYILHGHGTGGVLRDKVRQWLRSQSTVVKSWKPADSSDGGNAFTQVNLK